MPATFLCPHCSASYPVKPVLVGRAVRCTTCRNAFRLREDGVADKVESPAPEPTVAAPLEPPPDPRLAPTEVVETPARNGHAATPGSGSSGQRAASPGGRRTERLNAKQDELRKSLAASLATAASEALRSEAVQREAPPTPTARSARLGAAPEGGVGKIGPAVLTGHGRREHRNNVQWLLGCTGSVLVVVALGWLIVHKSPAERALHAYAAVVPAEFNKRGMRTRHIQERAWLAGQPPIDGLGRRITVHPPVRHDLVPVRTIAGELGLAELVFLGQPPVWAQADKAEAVRKRWNDRPDKTAKLPAEAGEGTVIHHDDVSARLREAGLSEDGETALMALIKGPLSAKAPADLGSKLLADGGPEAFELCRFSGVDGELLIDDGRDYRHRAVNYEGWLLRFIGGELPPEWRGWRVLSISTSAKR